MSTDSGFLAVVSTFAGMAGSPGATGGARLDLVTYRDRHGDDHGRR